MRMDKEKLSPFDWLNLLGLSGIAVICYCYVWGYSTFAEKHVQLPFLNFPIFVGEMLLMFCVGCIASVGGRVQREYGWVTC